MIVAVLDDRTHERDAEELDDSADSEELRQRYDTLLQEMRVLLPGVQVLLGFLLTVPFAEGFADLDTLGRRAWATSLLAALLSTVCLLTPTAHHRIGDRTERASRLAWGARMQVIGICLLAVAVLAGLWCVTRFIFDTATAWTLAAPVMVAMIALWILLPLTASGRKS